MKCKICGKTDKYMLRDTIMGDIYCQKHFAEEHTVNYKPGKKYKFKVVFNY